MSAIIRQILAVLLIGVITISSILIVQKVVGRAGVDLTEGNLYTLSEGTKKIVGSIQEPIVFKLYYARTATLKGNEQLRFWNNYYLYVRDLLEEFAQRSNAKITLEIIDPRPFSETEEEALEYGIQGIPMGPDEKFYFGLAAVTESGRDKVIKFFEPQRQELVEYDISKIIVELLSVTPGYLEIFL